MTEVSEVDTDLEWILAGLNRGQRESLLEAFHVAAETPDELLEEPTPDAVEELMKTRDALMDLFYATIDVDGNPRVSTARRKAVRVLSRGLRLGP